MVEGSQAHSGLAPSQDGPDREQGRQNKGHPPTDPNEAPESGRLPAPGPDLRLQHSDRLGQIRMRHAMVPATEETRCDHQSQGTPETHSQSPGQIKNPPVCSQATQQDLWQVQVQGRGQGCHVHEEDHPQSQCNSKGRDRDAQAMRGRIDASDRGSGRR